jgi:3-oxoisoapionate decarboxylase
LSDPVGLLDYCHRLGAGGIQTALGVRDGEYTAALRAKAEGRGMYIEALVGLPREPAGVDRFEAEVRTATQAGARAARANVIPGRRYEEFDSMEKFRQSAFQARRLLELAEPVMARHRLPLAIENHKDLRLPEQVELLRGIGSPWVGACVDVGNNLALLEDPIEVVETLAPWTHAVHLKDQAVAEHPDGFLMADVPLGRGILDLKKIVGILRKAKPKLVFTLEMLTRDPLKVPCLTERYWTTLGDVPGRDLARSLRSVRAHARQDLPQVSRLGPEEQAELELANVRECLAYARRELGL